VDSPRRQPQATQQKVQAPGPADAVVRSQARIFTIGHSTHPLDEFIRLLQMHGVQRLADVRTVPRSRYNPQFNRETLPDALAAARIRYVHLPKLGGLRHPRKESPNAGWRNDSFRGYADYMQTPEFAGAVDELIDLAGTEPLVIMCAEPVPWRCHRSLISDALFARGIVAEHIMSAAQRDPHTLTSFAVVQGFHVLYPAVPGQPTLPL